MNASQRLKLIMKMAIAFDEALFKSDSERNQAANVTLSEIIELTKSVITIDCEATQEDLSLDDTVEMACISFNTTKGEKTKYKIKNRNKRNVTPLLSW